MSILEDKIRKNKSHFDQSEPNEGHKKRFAEKLDEIHPEEHGSVSRISILQRIAAVFVVMLTVSLVLVLVLRTPKEMVAANQLPVELQEVQLYYDQLADDKIEQISECAINEEEARKLRDIASQELEEINIQTRELEDEYFKNAENEKIENALINNYKSKSEILDNILDRLCKL